MKITFIVIVLSILLIGISFGFVDSSKVDLVFGQSDNTLDQDGDGNEASQSEETSQKTNQNSMCVSGESTSSSCNNQAGQSIGSGQEGEQEPPSPLTLKGKLYVVEGPIASGTNTLIASNAYCDTGDTVTGGSFDFAGDGSSTFDMNVQSGPNSELDGWFVSAIVKGYTEILATAVCFDNP